MGLAHLIQCAPTARVRTRQSSVRRERIDEVRRWLRNYQELKEAIEAICELNHDLLRPEPHRRRAGGTA
jgi:hypothetical protein